MYRRDNPIQEFVKSVLYGFCSMPRMILEVMIRTSLGRRYFSFTLAMMAMLVMMAFPAFINYAPWNYYTPDFGDFLLKNLTWYCFIAIYFVYCLKHRSAQKARAASEFDLQHFTRSSGDILSVFTKLRLFGKPVTTREIETIVEPAFFTMISIVLLILGQAVGWLILFCAICYSISYYGAYWQGDEIILDVIDERIVNEGFFNVFVDGEDDTTHKGFRHRGARPSNREFRKNIADDMFGDDDEAAPAI